MNISLLLISFGVFQALFVLLFFVFSKKSNSNYRYLMIFLIVSNLLLCADYALSNYYILYSEKAFFGIGWSSSFWLALSPLYYLLAHSFLLGTSNSVKSTLLHLSPFFLSLIFSMPFFLLSAESRQEYLLSYSSGQEIDIMHIISKGIYHLQLVVYPILIYRTIKRKRISYTNFINVLNFSILFMGVSSFVHLIGFNFFQLSISWFTSNFVFICLTVFIHLTVLMLMARPNWVLKNINEVISKYTNSNLANVDIEKIQEDLKSVMDEQRIYLDSGLNLSKLATMLEITPHQLSEILNRKNYQSFNDYINLYRVNEAKEVLVDLDHELFTIESIAQKVGFNSSSTFYRSFKKETGLSPTKWLDQHQLKN